MAENHFEQVRDALRTEPGHSWLPPPDDLFHYTSGTALFGILSTSELWGGNFAFMNDKSEFEYGRSVLRKVLQESRTAATVNARKTVLGRASETMFRRSDPYFVCFCEAPDLLSQWRGYGGNASRYCLRLRSDSLIEIGDDVDGPISVLYDAAFQRNIAATVIDRHIEALADSATDKDITDCISSMYATLSTRMIRFKDPAFAEEREWRCYALFEDDAHVNALKFLPSDGVIRPYLPMLRGSEEEGGKLPITEVVVGAGRSDLHAMRSAELMLRHFGYEDVAVVSSKVPLLA